MAILITGLVLLATSPGLTQGVNNINLLLCGAMCVAPLVLCMRSARVFIGRIDTPLLLVCFFIFADTLLFHPETVRLSTMLFTCAYCVFIMMLARVLRISQITPAILMTTIRCIVYAFAIVLVIQQLCVLFDWPVFMQGARYANRLKLNSLTAEPSHTTVTLCALMFFYTQAYRIADPKATFIALARKQWLMWVCWVWVLFSPVNASAFVLAPLPFFSFINRRNLKWWALAALLGGYLLFGTELGNKGQLWRINEMTRALLKYDEDFILKIDGSAGARIVPTVRGAKALIPPDRQTLTGHGVDADMHDLPARPCDMQGRGFAGHFSLLYNYGLFCALALWWAIGATTLARRWPLSILTFLFAMQMSADYNMQHVWMLMAFGMVIRQLLNDKAVAAPQRE